MKQEEVMLSDITGKACIMSIFTKPIQTMFAQEERTIDEMCNDGDTQLRDFIDCNSTNHEHHLTCFSPKKKI